jgi:hypothetical protein
MDAIPVKAAADGIYRDGARVVHMANGLAGDALWRFVGAIRDPDLEAQGTILTRAERGSAEHRRLRPRP